MELIKSDTFKSFEFKELLLHSSASIIRIIVIYRPQISVKNGLTHAAFLDDFSSLLERLVSSTGHLLLAGDFNFHVSDPSDNNANKFLDLLSCFNLEVIMSTPRRIKTTTSLTSLSQDPAKKLS